MKALVKSQAGQGLWWKTSQAHHRNQRRMIRVRYTGICGTDVHIYQWDEWAQKTIKVPMTIGHEFVGEIVETGSNVNDFSRRHRQRRRPRGVRTLPKLSRGKAASLFGRPGRGRESARRFCGIDLAAHDKYLAARSKDKPGSRRDLRSFGNAVHTALSFPVHGEDVLITGAGPIGIMAIPVVRHAGARHIVVTDMNPFRLDLARKMGATLAVNPRDFAGRVQKQLGMQEGFDVGLEMSGNSQAFRDMIANMSHGGKIAVLGIPGKDITLDFRQVIFNMLTIKGIYGREMYETWYKMSVMLESGVDIEPIITHRFPYTDFQKGFDAMIAGQTGKVVLDWTSLI